MRSEQSIDTEHFVYYAKPRALCSPWDGGTLKRPVMDGFDLEGSLWLQCEDSLVMWLEGKCTSMEAGIQIKQKSKRENEGWSWEML